MKWIILGIAGAMEITWAVAMKYSGGFTQLSPSVITAVSYIASAVFLALALKNLPLGTAYAIWTGIGIIGTSVLGMLSNDTVIVASGAEAYVISLPK